jgi:hypothetical protein
MKTKIKMDLDVALKQFNKRKKANKKKKQVDNASLPAGAPMYFYCRFCGQHTETLPEGYFGKAKTICDPCNLLYLHGLI